MKKNFPYIIIAILLLIICVMVFGFVMNSIEKNNKNKGIVYEPYTSGNIVQAGSNLPGIAIPGWTAIKLPADTFDADVSLHNPNSNLGYYNLKFVLKLFETDEEIFSTGLIEPGYQCSKVRLNFKLEKGVYDAILFVQPYLQDDALTPVNNVEMDILLIVE